LFNWEKGILNFFQDSMETLRDEKVYLEIKDWDTDAPKRNLYYTHVFVSSNDIVTPRQDKMIY